MAIYHTLTRTVKENPQTGSIISDAIMDPETLGKGVKMFAQVTLKPAVPFLFISMSATMKRII